MLSSLSSLNLSLEFIDCAHCIELSKGYPRIWHRFATQEQRTILYAISRGECHYCGTSIKPNNFHADHKTPWKYSHNSDLSNLVASCYKCNIAKDTLSYARFNELLAEKGLRWRDRKYYATKTHYARKSNPNSVYA
jgi:5-methylcytosine-specific restriction endonuclease McrA